MKRALWIVLSLLLGTLSAQTQNVPTAGRTLVVIPFDNMSPTPGLEWLGEAFPVVFREQLNSPVVYVVSRDERLRAYDRLGIPAGLHASRATIYRLTEQMDVDYALLGSYKYDGARLTATAQLLDMRGLKLLPPVSETAPLTDLANLQSALAWDTLRAMRPDFSTPKERYIASIPPMRLDALENFVRAVLAANAEEKIRYYKEATRVNPTYSDAWLGLGRVYLDQRAYPAAISALEQVPPSSPVAREANFYLGLAAYDQGDLAKAETAFSFVAARLPLAEVYNNLGVVSARRGRKDAVADFERAIENDPSEADYHFNLGVTLSRGGEKTAATRAFRAALERRPNDAEAKVLLDSLSSTGAGVVPAAVLSGKSIERIKRNYEEDSFRQMTTQMQSWAEQRFVHSDPRSHARYHIELGKELLNHGFTEQAEREFREAGILDPANPAPLTGLAEVYDARGDAREARSQAEAALRLHESVDAYLFLARLDLRENRTEAAAQSVQRAVQLEPGNAAAQDLQRTVAAKLGEKAQ